MDEQKWIPVSERIPDVEEEVVGWDGIRSRIIWHEGVYNKQGLLEWWWRDERSDDNWNGEGITHWIPIPSDPES